MAQQFLVGQGLLHIEALRSHSDTPHSVGLLWMSDQPDAQTLVWQHTTLTKDTQTSSRGIRTRNPSKRAAADPRLRPRGQWNWLPHNYCNNTPIFPYKVITVIQCNGNGLCLSWGASWIIVLDVMQKKVSVFKDVRTLWFTALILYV